MKCLNYKKHYQCNPRGNGNDLGDIEAPWVLAQSHNQLKHVYREITSSCGFNEINEFVVDYLHEHGVEKGRKLISVQDDESSGGIAEAKL
jgi:hypothetical protein